MCNCLIKQAFDVTYFVLACLVSAKVDELETASKRAICDNYDRQFIWKIKGCLLLPCNFEKAVDADEEITKRKIPVTTDTRSKCHVYFLK